jgi:glycosyltransferase involved in cell wall biosynthesis
MRIAFFTETFLPKIDGIVNTLCYLLDHLSDRGHASLLFAPRGGPTQFAATPVVGLRGLRFPLYRELKLVPPTIDVRQHLERFQPDLIHVLNPVSLGVAGLVHARRLKVPVVASYHTDAPGFARRWGLGLFAGPLNAYTRWVHARADLNLCPSRYTQAQLAAQRFTRLMVWTRGVDTSRFNPLHRTTAWRERLSGGHPAAPLLLSVGRVSFEKRLDWLHPVLKALPEARLAIVGDGPARPSLEKLFADTPTQFIGYLRGDDLAQAYAAADAFLFPAANETLGNVVLEAMASGLPLVAARSGGVLDNVIDGQNGLLFDPDDQAALVRQTQRLIAEPELAARLRRAARAYAVSRTWGEVLDDLLDNYAALIEHQRLPLPRRSDSRLTRKLINVPAQVAADHI